MTAPLRQRRSLENVHFVNINFRTELSIGLLHDAEEVDVGVVDGEVDEDSARGAIQPQIIEQRFEQRKRLFHGRRQVLHESAAFV